MIFYGFPTPAIDEALGSWLFRCSVNRYPTLTSRLHLGDRPARWWEGGDLKYTDPDLHVLIAIERLQAAGFVITENLLRAHFAMRAGRPVAWNYRRLYCSECLREDLAKGQLPIWRKSWCYETSAICNVHGRFLNILTDSSRYSKAWDAFVADCNSGASRVIDADPMLTRLRLTTMSLIRNHVSHCIESDPTGISRLFEKLYRVFLQAPYKGSHGGIARIHFSTERRGKFTESETLDHSFLTGPATADASSRFGSIILAGALLGIISESRYVMLASAHESVNHNALLPRDLHQAAAFPYLSRSGYRTLHSFLGLIPRKSYPILDRHLQLQENKYKHDGAFDGRSLGLE